MVTSFLGLLILVVLGLWKRQDVQGWMGERVTSASMRGHLDSPRNSGRGRSMREVRLRVSTADGNEQDPRGVPDLWDFGDACAAHLPRVRPPGAPEPPRVTDSRPVVRM